MAGARELLRRSDLQGNRFPFWQSLRIQILGLFLVLILAGLYIAGLIEDKVQQRSHQVETVVASEKMGGEIENIILHLTLRAETLVTSIAEIAAITELQDSVMSQQIRALLANKGMDTYVAGGGIWPEPYQFDQTKRKHSLFWGSGPEGRLQRIEGYDQNSGIPYQEEDWYIPATVLQAGEVSWSGAYIDPYTKESMVTVSAPIFRNSKFWGVSTVDLSLTGLQTQMQKISEQSGGYTFVLDKQGRVILWTGVGSETEVHNRMKVLTDFIRPLINSGGKELVAEINKIKAATVLKPGQNSGTVVRTIHDPWLDTVSYANVKTLGSQGWILVAVFPENKLALPAENFVRSNMWWFVFLLVVTLSLAFTFVHLVISKPLGKLSSSLAEHPLGRVEVPGAAKQTAEIKSLISAVNMRSELIEKLLKQSRNAEQQVRNDRDLLQEEILLRTQDLQIAKDNAEAANRAKTQFLANISHELRSPMHAILSFSDLGVKKLEKVPLEKLGKYFNQIYESGNRLLMLLNNLLDLSKLESGHMEINFEKVDIRSIAESCAIEQESMLAAKELSVEVGEPLAKVSLKADKVLIRQVLNNLLSNAIKFSPKGGKIDLSFGMICLIGEHKDSMLISVSDQGEGVPPAELESIFDKYVQSSRVHSVSEGTGLGLAICREIIKAHDGKIWAQNRLPHGAELVFVLPLLDSENGIIGEVV